jgi:hypothetical protein
LVLVNLTRPVISGNGCNMGIVEERDKIRNQS